MIKKLSPFYTYTIEYNFKHELIVWLLQTQIITVVWRVKKQVKIAWRYYRIDEIVMFEVLSKEHIAKIIDIHLVHVCARLKEHEMELVVTSQVKAKLVEAGYDPVYGARPLKRVIRQSIENPLAQAILAGRFKSKDVINVGVSEMGEFIFG